MLIVGYLLATLTIRPIERPLTSQKMFASSVSPLQTMALASSSAENAANSWDGSYGQQTVQHIQQYNQGGKYVGKASSPSEAKSMANKAGYSGYNYYPSTGEVFGY